MSATRSRKRRQPRFTAVIQKPRGLVHPRVQRVGPEHFGVVCVDCAKARFKWMLCDFYGNVFVPPTVVAHNRVELDAALFQLREARAAHDIQDLTSNAPGVIIMCRARPSRGSAATFAPFTPSPPSSSASPATPASRPTTPT